MAVIKSFYVGNGDTFYIEHNSSNFTMIDCNLTQDDNKIIEEIKRKRKLKKIFRFISTHPDEDHIKGIEIINDKIGIDNFYVVYNEAKKDNETDSFKKYCELKSVGTNFFLKQGLANKWLNQEGKDENDNNIEGSGLSILWPDLKNPFFKEALKKCNNGKEYNNISPIIRYLVGNISVLWLGDLETNFMENIFSDIKSELKKTTIVFAPHHGRQSGRIPSNWLKILDPEIIILGSSNCNFLDYNYDCFTITQNRAKDITMLLESDAVHFYSSEEQYEKSRKKPLEKQDFYKNRNKDYGYYFGSITLKKNLFI